MIEAIVEKVWPAGVDRVERLGGGITNHNFKVSVGGEAFVLRVGGRDTARLGIDRRVEHQASLAATALGIGPEVMAFLEPEGYLVTRFVEGEAGRVTPRDAALLLARFHAGAPIGGRFDAFRVVETYAATAREAGVPLPPGHAEAAVMAARIERRRGPVRPVPCHNDLLAANFIHAGDRVWIVDWEYAGMGDPAFDLANYAANNRLDEAGDRELLAVYGAGDLGLHVLMRYMSDFREAMWGVVQQGLSELDFDFAGYAFEHFERLERARSEPRFRSALG